MQRVRRPVGTMRGARRVCKTGQRCCEVRCWPNVAQGGRGGYPAGESIVRASFFASIADELCGARERPTDRLAEADSLAVAA